MIFLALMFLGLAVTLCGSVAWTARHHAAKREAARLVATLPPILSTTIAVWDGPADEVPF